MDRTFSRWLPVLGVIAVLLIGGLAASMSSPEITNVPVPTPAADAPTPSALAPQQEEPPVPGADGNRGDEFEIPDWLLTGAMLLCGLLVLVLVGSLLYYLMSNRAARPKPRVFVEPEAPRPMAQAAADEVMAAVEAGLVELSDTDTDPRRAVIACWVRLERAAAAAGTPRLVGDSPTELVTRLLSAHQVSRPTLEGFAEVYREARYATHPVGERNRQDAITALRQIRAELSGIGASRSAAGGATGAP
ncbi:DUF4129 domain-containing protein [Dactylosporangium sp. NPDC049140]|uniref:DUF4129 domain-containing protein n=1 Tax=Dactylosporangium sp. NPDC049140 TaxID=3155647 RepID=UPI0033D11926